MVVQSDEDRGTSTVLFIDYGTSEEVSNSKLKVLPPSLRNQSPTAINCVISQPAILDITPEDFAKQVNGKTFSVVLQGDAEPYSLHIPDFEGPGE